MELENYLKNAMRTRVDSPEFNQEKTKMKKKILMTKCTK